YFWREVGRRMNIKELPADYDSFEHFNREYERQHYRYTDANHRVGLATLEMFASWFPRPLAPLVRQSMYAIMEEQLLEGFGFPRPWRGMRSLVHAAMKLRAGVLRWLPARRRPRLRTEMKHRTYPE